MKIDVKVDVFEGPLDLLLHLIEKNKIDIYDIPIVEITGQYIDYINKLSETVSMDVLSEFLVLAAALLAIKSRMLLPHDEEEEEEDPREELVRRLTEYKMYRYAAGELKDLNLTAGKIYYRKESIPEELKSYEEKVVPEEIVGDISLGRLNELFLMVMKRKKDRIDPVRSGYGRIEKEEYNVEDRMSDIRRMIRGMKRINFLTLLDLQPDREKLVVTFLAVLELMKTGEIRVSQEENFSQIFIDSREGLIEKGQKSPEAD